MQTLVAGILQWFPHVQSQHQSPQNNSHWHFLYAHTFQMPFGGLVHRKFFESADSFCSCQESPHTNPKNPVRISVQVLLILHILIWTEAFFFFKKNIWICIRNHKYRSLLLYNYRLQRIGYCFAFPFQIRYHLPHHLLKGNIFRFATRICSNTAYKILSSPLCSHTHRIFIAIPHKCWLIYARKSSSFLTWESSGFYPAT